MAEIKNFLLNDQNYTITDKSSICNVGEYKEFIRKHYIFKQNNKIVGIFPKEKDTNINFYLSNVLVLNDELALINSYDANRALYIRQLVSHSNNENIFMFGTFKLIHINNEQQEFGNILNKTNVPVINQNYILDKIRTIQNEYDYYVKFNNVVYLNKYNLSISETKKLHHLLPTCSFNICKFTMQNEVDVFKEYLRILFGINSKLEIEDVIPCLKNIVLDETYLKDIFIDIAKLYMNDEIRKNKNIYKDKCISLTNISNEKYHKDELDEELNRGKPYTLFDLLRIQKNFTKFYLKFILDDNQIQLDPKYHNIMKQNILPIFKAIINDSYEDTKKEILKYKNTYSLSEEKYENKTPLFYAIKNLKSNAVKALKEFYQEERLDFWMGGLESFENRINNITDKIAGTIGREGIGKTESIEELTKDLGIELFHINFNYKNEYNNILSKLININNKIKNKNDPDFYIIFLLDIKNEEIVKDEQTLEFIKNINNNKINGKTLENNLLVFLEYTNEHLMCLSKLINIKKYLCRQVYSDKEKQGYGYELTKVLLDELSENNNFELHNFYIIMDNIYYISPKTFVLISKNISKYLNENKIHKTLILPEFKNKLIDCFFEVLSLEVLKNDIDLIQLKTKIQNYFLTNDAFHQVIEEKLSNLHK